MVGGAVEKGVVTVAEKVEKVVCTVAIVEVEVGAGAAAYCQKCQQALRE